MVSVAKLLGVSLVLLVLLAGCAGSDEKKPKQSNQPSLSSDSPFGEIAGVVADEELQPIDSAELGLRGKDRTTRTAGDGEYRFTELEPGRYVVDVAKLGFGPLAQEVDVRAGQVTPLDFRLARVEIPNATFYDVSHFTGFYECSLGAVVWVSPCTYPYTAVYLTLHDHGVTIPGAPPDIQNNTFRYNFTVNPGATDIVSELTWQASTAASQRMQLILSCAQYDPILDDCTEGDQYAAVEGENPLRVQWSADSLPQTPDWVMARAYLPFFDPQLAFNQRFEMWNTIFYNGPAPKDFSLVAPQP